MYQALYRKYRPRSFDDVVGQSHITDTLKRQVASGRLSHAYLFTGTRGTGKTTCAKILSRAVNCEHPVDGNPCNECPSCLGIENGSILDVLELDAASNNGVDQVRALRDEAVYTPAAVRKRVYIVDEVHMLSTAAFNALLKILEEPPAHLMFILATTELHKVPATIKSRCQQFSFKRIQSTEIAGRLRFVAQQEGIDLTEEGAALLSRLADGGMRDALSLLDQCVAPGRTVDEGAVLAALGLAGNVETARLMEQVGGRETAAALATLDRLYAAGKDVGSLLGELSALTRDLLIRATAPRGGGALLTGGYDETTMRRLGELFSPERLVQMLGLLQTVGADLGRSANRRTDAELCLIRLCDERLDGSLEGLSARLARVEAALEAGVRITAAAAAPRAPEPEQRRDTPAQTEDRPPWEEPSAPAPSPAPKKAEETVRPAPVAPAAPAASAPQRESGGLDGGFWAPLVASLKGQVPMGEYTFLKNPDMVQGRLEGNILRLYVDSDFTREMVRKRAVTDPVLRAAPRGTERVEVTVGKAPAQTQEHEAPQPAPGGGEEDALEDLLAFGKQFDNIVIKE